VNFKYHQRKDNDKIFTEISEKLERMEHETDNYEIQSIGVHNIE
jgi:hypothetical protein